MQYSQKQRSQRGEALSRDPWALGRGKMPGASPGRKGFEKEFEERTSKEAPQNESKAPKCPESSSSVALSQESIKRRVAPPRTTAISF